MLCNHNLSCRNHLVNGSWISDSNAFVFLEMLVGLEVFSSLVFLDDLHFRRVQKWTALINWLLLIRDSPLQSTGSVLLFLHKLLWKSTIAIIRDLSLVPKSWQAYRYEMLTLRIHQVGCRLGVVSVSIKLIVPAFNWFIQLPVLSCHHYLTCRGLSGWALLLNNCLVGLHHHRLRFSLNFIEFLVFQVLYLVFDVLVCFRAFLA